MKRSLIALFVLLFAGGMLAACGDDEGGDGGSAAETTSESAASDFNDADVEFVQGMIPHHQQAVEMAELAETNGEGAEVKDLAARIKEAQGPEIETMQGWLQDWGVDESGEDTGMDHGSEDDSSAGSGMMSEDDMVALEAAEGAEFDEMFLTRMIEHHEGAVEMANVEIEDGKNQDAIDLAEAIISAQEAEIEEMNGLLGETG